MDREKGRKKLEKLKNFKFGDITLAKNRTPKRAQFKHRPIDISKDELRLVKILPCSHAGHISCSIEHFDRLQGPLPKFRALSYTWGPPPPTISITVNGCNFQIRTNLYHFLLTIISHPEAKDYLWIDQLCIDQTSVSERNHQVRQIGKTFAAATVVIAWLGLSDENSMLVARKQWHLEEHWLLPRESLELRSSALEKFFSRPYWSRLWIVQELCLAADILYLCSNEQILESELNTAELRTILGSLNCSAAYNLLKSLHQSHLRRRQDFEDLSLMTLVVRFANNGCEDPRDRIFGLLGIVHPNDRVDVDYNKSRLEVCVDVMNSLRRSTSSSFPLSTAQKNFIRILLEQVAGLPNIEVIQPVLERTIEEQMRSGWFDGGLTCAKVREIFDQATTLRPGSTLDKLADVDIGIVQNGH